MWKQILEAKVIRVEGLDENDLRTQVTSMNKENIDLFPYNLDKGIELMTNSLYRFHLYTLDNTISFSISFSTSMIQEDGVHWLPLYKSTDSDTIDYFPEEVKAPRVLILLHKKLLLDIIREGNEKSELGSACEDDYMPEIKLCSSFIDGSVQEFEEADEVTQKVGVSDGMFVGVNDGVYVGVSERINEELEENLKKLEKLLEIEKKSKENLVKELETVKKVYKDELDQAKIRENELVEEYKKVEMQGSEYRVLVTQLKNELKSMKSENLRITQLMQSNEISTTNKIEEMKQKIEVYEQNHSNSDQIFTKLAEMTSRSLPNSSVLQEKDEAIKKLKNEIADLKNCLFNSAKNQYGVDELEEAVQRFSKGTKLAGFLIRDREQTYIYNNKKISMLLKDGQLLCRVGGIFKPFSDFIQSTFQAESSLLKQVRSPQQEIKQSEDRSKASPSRKVNKSFTSVSKSAKRGSLI